MQHPGRRARWGRGGGRDGGGEQLKWVDGKGVASQVQAALSQQALASNNHRPDLAHLNGVSPSQPSVHAENPTTTTKTHTCTHTESPSPPPPHTWPQTRRPRAPPTTTTAHLAKTQEALGAPPPPTTHLATTQEAQGAPPPTTTHLATTQEAQGGRQQLGHSGWRQGTHALKCQWDRGQAK